MDCKMLAVAIVVFSLVSYGHAVAGRSLYEDDMELERELKAINKLAVNTIKTEYGDIYDCVDIYKQPALDHPLLKDHKIQMRPTFSPKLRPTTNVKASSKSEPSLVTNSLQFGLKEGCPRGTVPIRRATKEQLIRANSNFRRLHQKDFSNKVTGNGFEFAGLETETNAVHIIGGAEAHIDIYQPTVKHGQLSAAAITVQSGGPGMIGSIWAGWMVHPDLYGDSRTRMFTSWSEVNNGHISGCFNTICPGFVIVNPIIPLDMPFDNISAIRGIQYDMKFSIIQDMGMNWWLMVNDSDETIGYWPSQLFTDLGNGADKTQWGGLVYSHEGDSPPMGSGQFGFKFSNYTSYMRQVLIYTYENREVPTRMTDSRCYEAGGASYKGDYWGFSFVFGGRGGSYSTCFI